MIRGQCVADPHSDVMADHGEPLVPERIHECHHVACEGAGAYPSCGLSDSRTPLVDPDNLPRDLQQRRGGNGAVPCSRRLGLPLH